MIYKTIILDQKDPEITLTAYIPDVTSEYLADRVNPAVIVCPGGAYQFLSEREGECIALKYSSEGYAAFVLRYHVGLGGGARQPQPLLDLGRAVICIKSHAQEWRIDKSRISICGFSAGGHLCASYAAMWHHPWLSERLQAEKEELEPFAAVLAYPLADLAVSEVKRRCCPTKLLNDVNIAMFGEQNPAEEMMVKYSPVHQVTEKTVPCFIWHTAEDELVDVRNSIHLAEALSVHKVIYELHIYPYGKHGLALSNQVTDCGEGSVRPEAAGWFEAMMVFLNQLYFSRTE